MPKLMEIYTSIEFNSDYPLDSADDDYSYNYNPNIKPTQNINKEYLQKNPFCFSSTLDQGMLIHHFIILISFHYISSFIVMFLPLLLNCRDK